MNWVRAGRAVLLATAALAGTACGTDSGSTAPSNPSLFTPQFSGTWSGTAVLASVTSVADGECVQPTLQAQVGTAAGTERVTLSMTQDLQALTARLSSATSGLSCSYKGTAAQNTLALDASACDAEKLIVRCANGAVRNLEPVGSTVQGTVTGGQVNGTVATSYNAFDAVTGYGVTRVTMNYQLTAAKP